MFDCLKKQVHFDPCKAKFFELQGTSRHRAVSTISAMAAKKLSGSGCVGYLASTIDVSKESEVTPRETSRLYGNT